MAETVVDVVDSKLLLLKNNTNNQVTACAVDRDDDTFMVEWTSKDCMGGQQPTLGLVPTATRSQQDIYSVFSINPASLPADLPVLSFTSPHKRIRLFAGETRPRQLLTWIGMFR